MVGEARVTGLARRVTRNDVADLEAGENPMHPWRPDWLLPDVTDVATRRLALEPVREARGMQDVFVWCASGGCEVVAVDYMVLRTEGEGPTPEAAIADALERLGGGE